MGVQWTEEYCDRLVVILNDINRPARSADSTDVKSRNRSLFPPLSPSPPLFRVFSADLEKWVRSA